jgi:putative oligomerization/nucleic acid binding protein
MPGLVRMAARTAVVAGTATAVSNRVARRQAGRWAAQEQQQQPYYPEPQPPPPPAAQAPAADTTTQLKQLAELRQQGILTEVEFQAQKQKILGA